MVIAIAIAWPPSTRSTVPVVKLDASLARYSAAPTISCGWPPRPIGYFAACCWNASRSHALEMSVKNGPAMIVLTRTFGPYAWANPTVRTSSPDLAAAYGSSPAVGRMAATLLTLMIEPPSPSAMRGAINVISRNGPLRLTPITLSKRSSVTSGRLGYSG